MQRPSSVPPLATGARDSRETFLVARTDARAIHGLDEALRRAERYLKAGADGIFVEAPETLDELRKVGSTFRGVPQIANMLEPRYLELLRSGQTGSEFGFFFF